MPYIGLRYYRTLIGKLGCLLDTVTETPHQSFRCLINSVARIQVNKGYSVTCV